MLLFNLWKNMLEKMWINFRHFMFIIIIFIYVLKENMIYQSNILIKNA